MKAAIYTRTGAARDVLHLEDVDRPEPAAGEVRVRVCVSGAAYRRVPDPPPGWSRDRRCRG
jgi:NADPH:quinone reductase-like Zn-dependent oxidoreductase